MKTPTIKDFTRARLEFDESAQQVADKFGCSRTYVYEVLKYPNKNRELHAKIVNYCNSAEEKTTFGSKTGKKLQTATA